jgi:2-polyprenyl-3-methyl-5-hydroxy-6-metoxy-1,4-benzoquinol methylase
MQKALNEWNEQPDQETLNYHLRQWREPYRQTVAFADFIKDYIKFEGNYIDAGCGAGASTHYFSERFFRAKFTGIDISETLIGLAREQEKGTAVFDTGNLNNLEVRFGVDGVTLLQVLHTMPGYGPPLHQIATRIRPRWIAFSTLIYEGDIDSCIVVTEHQRPRAAYHNIYGLPRLTMFMAAERYTLKKYEPFDIDIDIRRPLNPDLMGTWTDHGMQRSGPLLMPWAFCLFERNAQ